MGEINARQREIIMPLFITQGRFTREYIKGGLAKPEDRHAAISRICEQAGGKLVSLYFTLGQYDFVVVSEMPDAKTASVLALVAAGGGGIEGSVTTQAFTSAEAREMFRRRARSRAATGPWAHPDESVGPPFITGCQRICRSSLRVYAADVDIWRAIEDFGPASASPAKAPPHLASCIASRSIARASFRIAPLSARE